MVVRIEFHRGCQFANVWSGDTLAGFIKAEFAHLIKGAVLHSPMTVDDLEQMDDFAHTSGRAKALERATAYQPPFNPAEMVAKWRERAARHRATAQNLCGVLRWLRNHPEAPAVRFDGCDWSAVAARKELAHQRHKHSRCCGQLGLWLRPQAAQQTAPALALPPAANDAAQAAGKVA
ncbi:hypothetical protein FBZ82_101156 [Azospirillum brasilense]|uniref:Uncharacterized protein n=1 Tax=Azospirillum brasilense TaxID=192 RepID=A0A560BNG4_AZOBR|nr:hypothetical protein [Azospirillum brasilense]TWA74141.1 hypothetical protein FBZ82_101156 [Azospirillum brasilense]